MRACLVSLSLCVSLAAQAATWSGRVLHQGAPVNGARVSVFSDRPKPLAGCKSARPNGALGTCLCPKERDAFTAQASAGLESAAPLASATTGPDGAFAFSLEATGPLMVHATSADGARSAVARSAPGEPTDIALEPAVVSRLRLEGLVAGAAVYAIDPFTGEVVRFAQRDGVWVSPPLPPGRQTLLATAPGAVPMFETLSNGRPMGAMGSMRMALRSSDQPERVRLAAPGMLRGVVTDRGLPVAGVEVVEDPDRCALRTRTDAEGAFALPSVLAFPALATVTARAGGKFAAAYGSEQRFAELALKPAARLELTFVDSAGAPVSGVEVWPTGQEGANRWTPPSDAQGRWALGELTEGSLQLHLHSPYVLLSDPAVTLPGGVTRLRPVVARGATLTGVVRDAKGKPAANVNVSVSFAEATQAKVSEGLKEALRMKGAITDAQGHFALEGLLPGEYAVVAKSVTSGEGAATGSAPGTLALGLEAPFVLEGLVVDAAGAPVDQAHVTFRRKGETNIQYGTSTEADGRFRYALKSPGTFEVSAARTHLGPSTKPQLAELPGGPLTFVVGEPLWVRGTVVDPGGRPRAGVVVQAISTSFPQLAMAQGKPQPIDPTPFIDFAKQLGMYAEATTDGEGGFAIALPSEALLFTEPGAEFAEPVKGSPTSPVRLVLAPHARATGRVLDWTGRPVPTFSINGKQFTSAEGRFEAPLPARGSASLRIDAALAPSQTRAVEVPPTPTEVPLGDIRLGRGFTIRGKVLAAETRKPITPSPSLDARSEGGQFDSGAIQADGSFVLKRVPEGKLVLAVSHARYAPVRVTLEAKAGLPEQVLALQQTASLELKVLTFGEPAGAVTVEAIGPDTAAQPPNRRTLSTSMEGTVALSQLSPGVWTLKFSGSKTSVRTVKLEPGQQAKLEVNLP